MGAAATFVVMGATLLGEHVAALLLLRGLFHKLSLCLLLPLALQVDDLDSGLQNIWWWLAIAVVVVVGVLYVYRGPRKM